MKFFAIFALLIVGTSAGSCEGYCVVDGSLVTCTIQDSNTDLITALETATFMASDELKACETCECVAKFGACYVNILEGGYIPNLHCPCVCAPCAVLDADGNKSCDCGGPCPEEPPVEEPVEEEEEEEEGEEELLTGNGEETDPDASAAQQPFVGVVAAAFVAVGVMLL